MRILTRIAVPAVIVATAAAAMVAWMPAAGAVSGCSSAGFNRTIPVVGSNGTVNVSERAYYCTAVYLNALLKVVPGAPPPEYESAVLRQGRSWFICQYNWVNAGGLVSEYGNPAVATARNNWWLYTYGDYANPGTSLWGWFPATKVAGGANYAPEPGLPTCDSLGIYPMSYL